MSVCSYVVYTEAGQKGTVLQRLTKLKGCTAEPVPEQEMIVLMTETEDATEEKMLQKALNGTPGIEAMLLAFGSTYPKTEEIA